MHLTNCANWRLPGAGVLHSYPQDCRRAKPQGFTQIALRSGYGRCRGFLSGYRQITRPHRLQVLRALTNPWKELGIPEDADDETVKRAYRKLALKHHPDVNRGSGAEQRFKAIMEAYQILSGRLQGSTEPDTSAAGGRGSWDFHDWYWKFTINRRWEKQHAKDGKESPISKPQPQNKDQVLSQLAGLKRKAAVRARVRTQPQSQAQTQQPAEVHASASQHASQHRAAVPSQQPSDSGDALPVHTAPQPTVAAWSESAATTASQANASPAAASSVRVDAGGAPIVVEEAAATMAHGTHQQHHYHASPHVAIGRISRVYSAAATSPRSHKLRSRKDAAHSAGDHSQMRLTSVRIEICNALRHARQEIVHAAYTLSLRLPVFDGSSHLSADQIWGLGLSQKAGHHPTAHRKPHSWRAGETVAGAHSSHGGPAAAKVLLLEKEEQAECSSTSHRDGRSHQHDAWWEHEVAAPQQPKVAAEERAHITSQLTGLKRKSALKKSS